jgi:hypothetical protein
LIAIGVIRLLAGLLDALFFVGTGGGVTSAATLDALFFVGTGGGVTSAATGMVASLTLGLFGSSPLNFRPITSKRILLFKSIK